MSEMPHDNPSYTAADFRQYAEGSMLPAERHALEKAALEDPFLADALEGYLEAFTAHGLANVNSGLEAAKEAIAAKTTAEPVAAPVIPMRSNRWWAVAAVIAVLILAGWFLFTPSEKPEENTLAVTPPVPAVPVTDAPKNDTVFPSGNAPLQESTEKEKVSKTATQARELKDQDLSLDKKNIQPAPPEASVVSADDKVADQLEKVKAAETAPTASKKEANAGLAAQLSVQLNNFEGRVTDLNNNPLSNATVRIANTNNGVITNDKGFFNLKSADSVVPVEVTVIGYATQQTQLRNTDKALNTIQLPENKRTLSEVVVTKPLVDPKKEKTVYRNQSPTVMVQDAEPANGWIEFDRYLQQAKTFSSNQKLDSGDVVISFLVDRNGKRSSFRIEQSLSEVQDAEAERLIQAGPSWRLLKGRKARATVIIHF